MTSEAAARKAATRLNTSGEPWTGSGTVGTRLELVDLPPKSACSAVSGAGEWSGSGSEVRGAVGAYRGFYRIWLRVWDLESCICLEIGGFLDYERMINAHQLIFRKKSPYNQ